MKCIHMAKSPRERHNFAKNAPNPGKAAALIRSEKEAGKTDPRKNSCQASEKISMYVSYKYIYIIYQHLPKGAV